MPRPALYRGMMTLFFLYALTVPETLSSPLPALFARFHDCAAQALAQDDKWLVIDPVYEHMELLAAQPLEQLLPHILQLVETYPMLDYGGPGPFGSLIEEHPMAAYTPALLASLQRQPSVQIMGWLDRCVRAEGLDLPGGPNPVRPADYAAVLEQLLHHPLASDECKEFAQDSLEDARKAIRS